jgi:hypothetical protein
MVVASRVVVANLGRATSSPAGRLEIAAHLGDTTHPIESVRREFAKWPPRASRSN